MNQVYSTLPPAQDRFTAWLNYWYPSLSESLFSETSDDCFLESAGTLEGDHVLFEARDHLIPTNLVGEASQQTWPNHSSANLSFSEQYFHDTSIADSDHTILDLQMEDAGNILYSPSYSSSIFSMETPVEGSVSPTTTSAFEQDNELGEELKVELSTPSSMQAVTNTSTRKARADECRLQRRREQNRVSQKRYRSKKEALIVEAENHVRDLENTVQHQLRRINEEEKKIAELNEKMSVLRVHTFSCRQLALLSVHS